MTPAASGLCAIGTSLHSCLVCGLVCGVSKFKANHRWKSCSYYWLSPFILLVLPGKWLEFFMIRNISAGRSRLSVFLLSAVHLLSHGDEIRSRIVVPKGPAS